MFENTEKYNWCINEVIITKFEKLHSVFVHGFQNEARFFICKVVNGKQIYELRLKVGEYLIFGPHCSTFFRAYQKSWAKVFSKIFSKAKTLLKLLYNLSDVMVFLRENREGNFYVVVSLND